MKQIAVRIGGFVVNAGSQTIVLDRNVDVEKSNARSGNNNFITTFSSVLHQCALLCNYVRYQSVF